MAIAFVQAPTGTGASTASATITNAFVSPVSTGSLITVGVSWDTSSAPGQTSPTVTDNFGNTYVEMPNCKKVDTTHNQGITAYYAKNVTGGTNLTVTATWSSTVLHRRLLIAEYSGVDPTSPLDQSTSQWQTAPGTGTDAVTSGAITTLANNELAWSMIMLTLGTVTRTAGTNYTKRSETVVGSGDGAIEDQIQASAGSIAGTWTISATNPTLTAIATFKPLSGTATNRTQDVRITGATGPNTLGPYGTGTFGTMVFGQSGTQISVAYDARLTGRNASNVAYDARLAAQQTTSTTQTTAITAGAASSFFVYEARITGRNTNSVAFDAKITSGNPSSVAYDARQIGQTASNVTYQARLTAQTSNAVIYDTRVTGQNTSSASFDARLTAQGAPFVAYDARIVGQATTNVAYATAITGQTSSNRTQDIRQTGRLTSNVIYDVRTAGQLSSLVSYDVREIGRATSNVTYDIRITGQASTNVAYNIRITGQSAVSSVAYDTAISAQNTDSIEFAAFITGAIAPQIAVPVADNFTGTWHVTPLWAKINTDDGDYIESGSSPTIVDVCEVQLGPLNDPLSPDAHIIRYRYSKDSSGGDRIDLVVRLMQGTTQISAWSHADIDAITMAEHTLTGTEADSITDYSDLKLRFEAIKV